MQKFRVLFDSGDEVEAEVRSRDLVKLEAAGLDIESLPPLRGSYVIAHAALQRLSRAGKITVAVPDTVDGLIDVADLESVEDANQGEGSGQAAPTG